MKRQLKSVTATALITIALTGNAADTQDNNQSNVYNKDPHCPDIVLHRETPPDERITGAVYKDDPLFLSEHYCMAYAKDLTRIPRNKLPTKISYPDVRKLVHRYRESYRGLAGDEQKIAFAHLFLKSLSRQLTVFPMKSDRQKIQILIPSRSDRTINGGQRHVKLQLIRLEVDGADYHTVYNGLLDLADKPAIDKQWPELVKRVESVIKNTDLLAQQ